MDSLVSESWAGRPAKRRRGSGVSQDLGSKEPHDDRKTASTLGMAMRQEAKATSASSTHSLTHELERLLHKNPSLLPYAVQLVSFYQRLWDRYVMEYATKIRLGEEHRLLQDSNTWLASGNEQVQRLCTERGTLLSKHRQASESIRRALDGILENCDKPILSLAE